MVLGPGQGLHPFSVRGGRRIDGPGDGRRADEADGAHVRVREQSLHLLPAAVDHLHQPVRGAGLGQQLHQPVGDRRVLLRGLQHERVAAGDGQREHPQRHHGREVERRDARAHPDGLNEAVGVDAPGDVLDRLAHHQRGDAAGVLHHLDAAPDLAPRIVPGLAGVPAQEPGDVVLVLLQNVLVGEQQPRPLRRRHVAPRPEGRLRPLHRAVHLAGGGEGHLADHFLGGGIGHVDAAGAAVDESTVHEELELVHGAVSPNRDASGSGPAAPSYARRTSSAMMSSPRSVRSQSSA